MQMTINEVVKELMKKDFVDYLRKQVDDKTSELLDSNPEEYGGYWDSNPYMLEPQLASGSGRWEFPESGENRAYEDAKEIIIEYFFDGGLDLPEKIDEFLADYDNKDKEWLTAILVNLI